jgi:photosystem II stability/assembly factor-like uncharacterized protein
VNKLLIGILLLVFSISAHAQWSIVFACDPNIITYREFYDIHFKDDSNGIVIGDFDPGIIRTYDGGSTWSFDKNSFRSDLYLLSFSDKDTGLVVVSNNYVYFTYDGGITFKQDNWQVPIQGHLSSHYYEMINSEIIYTAGSYGRIAKSIDGGLSWLTYNGFEFSNSLNKISCLDKNLCYACGDVAKIVKTIDGGNSWTQQEAYINNDLCCLYIQSADTVFAAGKQGSLIKTTDGGLNWNIISSNVKGTIIGIRFWSASYGYLVSSLGELSYTLDGGANWNNYHFLSPELDYYNPFNQIYFKDKFTLFGVTEDKIYRCKLSQSELLKVPLESAPNSINISYNQLNKDLVIDINPETQINRIEIFNISGINLMEEKGICSSNYHINLGSLKPGLYLVRISMVNMEISTKRFITQ